MDEGDVALALEVDDVDRKARRELSRVELQAHSRGAVLARAAGGHHERQRLRSPPERVAERQPRLPQGEIERCRLKGPASVAADSFVTGWSLEEIEVIELLP